ncbi:LOW QUALITY PROTEIN: uncharacterized protein LOC110030699 [Phalaenopsis equestris]|uniref:LOW QUALITY PROTEIN: uncharacterized protein LOC110030699 n=1 Tax=Phalaenopsis equestris TaxID=78828 RepID=UPI0009E64E00|nr:LOW QUALITY PROTEIN: uncharacterized protein LOC110030699 [Phalaenopsis equestris]
MENQPLIRQSSTMVGVVDYRGRPISRSSSGRWTSVLFIIGAEIAERMAYNGISFNLISYLTGPLKISTAAAASSVNNWSGASMLLPLLGAFVADSFLGRYHTIVLASLLYVLSLGLLTLSAVLSSPCSGDLLPTLNSSSCSPAVFHVVLFFLSLYLVAFAEGGHKPCLQAFGADQFDDSDNQERIERSSFFNWWYFGMNIGMFASFIVFSYIQESIGWSFGFGIPCAVMGIALLVFLLGSRTYRCYPLEDTNPFVRIGKGFVTMVTSRQSSADRFTFEVEARDSEQHCGCHSDQYRKLVEQEIEEAKRMLQLLPIWATCLAIGVVFSQCSTLFNKQGVNMDRLIGPSFQLPSAALQSIISIVILAFIPLYDRVLVPMTRNLSGLSSGITHLKRIGIGLFFSVVSMVIAALVEMKRVETAREHGLIDEPNATVPMSILWLFPQYILFGIMDVFGIVGLQEFFYDQVPDALRSLGLALYLSIFGIGSIISGLLVSVIDKETRRKGESWFSDNLNRAHLDNFYWLLAGLSAVSLVLFVYFARSYVYKKEYRIDHRGRPASRASSGRWTAALFIIGVEIAERIAYYGISSNLITYLTGSVARAGAAPPAVNTWSGVSSMLPLVGAFVADSYFGRYKTILFASLVYVLGLGLLTLSSLLPNLRPPKCIIDGKACSPNHFQTGFFYFALYLVALAQGGHKPCTQAFGADQFDENDPEEYISRSSFFNWWYCGICLGTAVTIIILNYVQDNISWALGFSIPCISMVLALILFLLGTKTYRFYELEGENPFHRIGKSFVTLVKSHMATSHGLTGSQTSVSDEFDHTEFEKDEAKNAIQIEEAKGVLQLVPIWATCLIYAVVFAQSSTFFTKQGSTLDRRIGSSFEVPPAALQSFISISIVAFIPIYDRIIVPVSRKFSRIPTGITQLQRIGVGMFLSLIAMAIAALVETKRLKIAKDYGLIDQPKIAIPMSLWWLVPQYIIYGIADVFTMVGLQEFFYDQVPDALRSLGLALYLSIFGIGNFISSFLITVINETTSKSGVSWFSDNLNRAHLDYFYWLLAGLSAAELIFYLYFTRSYVYKKKQNAAV